MGHRSCELDMAHPFAADLGTGDFDAASLTDDALEAHSLVLAAVTLPIPRRTEDLFAEQTVALGLQRPVVDCLRLLHLTVRPLANLVGSGQADADLVEEVHVEHSLLISFLLTNAISQVASELSLHFRRLVRTQPRYSG